MKDNMNIRKKKVFGLYLYALKKTTAIFLLIAKVKKELEQGVEKINQHE